MITLTVNISEFDYSEKFDQFIPDLLNRIKESGDSTNPLMKIACAAPGLSTKLLKTAIDAMSQKQKDALASRLINSNEDKIISSLTDLADRYGIDITIDNAEAAVNDPEPAREPEVPAEEPSAN